MQKQTLSLKRAAQWVLQLFRWIVSRRRASFLFVFILKTTCRGAWTALKGGS